MTGDAKRGGPDQTPGRAQLSSEEKAAFQRRLDEIGAGVDQAKARGVQPAQRRETGESGAAMGQAFRIVSELVVGVAVGGGLGWLLDGWLKTGPWLMVLFVILGFAAGLMNVIRTARQMQAEAEPLQRSAKAVKDDDDDN